MKTKLKTKLTAKTNKAKRLVAKVDSAKSKIASKLPSRGMMPSAAKLERKIETTIKDHPQAIASTLIGTALVAGGLASLARKPTTGR